MTENTTETTVSIIKYNRIKYNGIKRICESLIIENKDLNIKIENLNNELNINIINIENTKQMHNDQVRTLLIKNKKNKLEKNNLTEKLDKLIKRNEEVLENNKILIKKIDKLEEKCDKLEKENKNIKEENKNIKEENKNIKEENKKLINNINLINKRLLYPLVLGQLSFTFDTFISKQVISEYSFNLDNTKKIINEKYSNKNELLGKLDDLLISIDYNSLKYTLSYLRQSRTEIAHPVHYEFEFLMEIVDIHLPEAHKENTKKIINIINEKIKI